MCKFFLANCCQRGDLCAYAHSDKEIRLLPDLKCTQLCPVTLAGKVCMDAECKFAHRSMELKIFPGSNSHKTASNDELAHGGLKLTQVSLAAVAARHALKACSNDDSLRSSEESAVLRQELCALIQAQASISQALAALEEQVVSSNCQGRQSSQNPLLTKSSESQLWGVKEPALSDGSTVECDSDSFESKSYQQKPDRQSEGFGRQMSWADMSEESELDSDGAAPDFDGTFSWELNSNLGREVNCKQEVDMGRSDATADASISTSIGQTYSKKSMNTFCYVRRPVPERNEHGRPGAQTTGSTKDYHSSELTQQSAKRCVQARRSKPVPSKRQNLQAPGPLPAGLVQPGPFPRLPGKLMNDSQVMSRRGQRVAAA